MYLYQISVQTSDHSGATADLIGKLLHNWRTHHKNNIAYRTTLARVILLCLTGTYMLSSVTELVEMLKYCQYGYKAPPNVSDIVHKIGYTSLPEVEKLSKILKLSNKSVQKNVVYGLSIESAGNYILTNEYASFVIAARTLPVHVTAVNASSRLAKLDHMVLQAILTQSRDNNLNSNGVSYASRNSKGTLSIHLPVSAETCMDMGYDFYTDKSTIWAVYYERSDSRFRITKVEHNRLIDTTLVNLQKVTLIKPAFKLS
ncbi:hypothetical protein BC943DRAFT_323792 [Umbelopsis sp. AD052]|nr:hypothetical protein BC943DRAFT_323792 [Umbelopsis sp. AD052]